MRRLFFRADSTLILCNKGSHSKNLRPRRMYLKQTKQIKCDIISKVFAGAVFDWFVFFQYTSNIYWFFCLYILLTSTPQWRYCKWRLWVRQQTTCRLWQFPAEIRHYGWQKSRAWAKESSSRTNAEGEERKGTFKERKRGKLCHFLCTAECIDYFYHNLSSFSNSDFVSSSCSWIDLLRPAVIQIIAERFSTLLGVSALKRCFKFYISSHFCVVFLVPVVNADES